MKNAVQLITYVDRLGGGDLKALKALLEHGPLQGLFGGVHLLPFFHPIDGADAGFDPIDHLSVDKRLGDWADVQALAQSVEVMGDVIVNHMSASSPQFLDYQAKGAASEYAGLFLRMDKVFPEGATEHDLLGIYRPRPGLPFTPYPVAGHRELLWTTFTPQQLDIDISHPQGKAYLSNILQRFAGSVATTCPSPAHQIALELKPGGGDSYCLEPPGYQLHWWNGTALVTHTAVLGDWPGPFPFREGGELID